MDKIESLVQSIESFQNASVIKLLKSKKNTVCLIEIKYVPYVLKLYPKNNVNAFYKEKNILSTTNHTYLRPQMFSSDELHRYILLEYKSGENICDLINDKSLNLEKKVEIIKHLAQWFHLFHKYHFKNNSFTIHGDANLRNFLFDKNIVGLDFEETRNGNPIKDIAQICASILTTNPQFTEEKKELKEQFIHYYQKQSKQQLPLINEEIENALEETKKRRKNKNHKNF